MDGDVPAARGDDDVAMKDDGPCRFRQVYRMGERGPSAAATPVPCRCRRRRWRSLGCRPVVSRRPSPWRWSQNAILRGVGIPGLAEYLLYLRKSNGRKAVPRQRAITTAYVTARGGVIIGEFAGRDKTAFGKIDGGIAGAGRVRLHAGCPAVAPRAQGCGVARGPAEPRPRGYRGTDPGRCRRGHRVGTPAGGSCDLSAATGRKRFRGDADDAACEVGHGRERVLAARAEGAAGGRRGAVRGRFGWELDTNRVDAGGTPVRDDDGNPVRGILPLRQDEADARAQARRDVPGGAAVGGIARDWDTRGILTPTGEAVARTRSRAGAPPGPERGSDGVPGQDHRDRAVASGRG